jgi:hypothetical protein
MKKPCDYTAADHEEQNSKAKKIAKGIGMFIFIIWGLPMIVFAPFVVLDHYTGVFDTPGTVSDEYCSPSLFGGCD